jgi:carboxy-terminal domain RNA polymerase II polypeptide A small phosphatase
MASSTQPSTTDKPTSHSDATTVDDTGTTPAIQHSEQPAPTTTTQSPPDSTRSEDRPLPEPTEAKSAGKETDTSPPLSQKKAANASEATAVAAKDDKETEPVDEGSTSNTLSGSQQRSSSIRRKTQASAASETTRAAPNGNSASKPVPLQKQKPSRLSRFFRKLVPCIPPPPPDADQDVVNPKALTAKPEPEALKPAEKSIDTSDAARSPGTSAGPAPEQTNLPPPIDISATAKDDIVVPPTPTADAPAQPETEVTSRAVVPPGSTGSSSVNGTGTPSRRHSVAQPDEPDSETSDEDDPEDSVHEDIEDEEERLIMNGGAGIPIGPVR